MAVQVGTKGYLYSRWRGKFEVYEGYADTTYTIRGWARFVIGQGRNEKRMQCSPFPYEIYNGVVWMPERDDKKAREMFIEYEHLAIQELKKKIERHESAIQMLEELDV